ncbi:MAG: tetratricopeptide repeat protein [Paracoccaceae bacterium]
MENRRTKPAIAAYQQASDLAPHNAMIQGGLGRALLADGQYTAAVEALQRSRDRDSKNAYVLRDLGQAYAHLGQNGMAALATAERFALWGEMENALLHARRAMVLLPEGSVPWRRAEDVLVTAERLTKRKKR